jgi:hypothetical protein
VSRLRQKEQVWVAKLDAGVDFADGLHLASRGEASSFATFDERFAKRTAKLSIATRVYFDSKNKGHLLLTKKQPFPGLNES